jgi:TonB-dependent SusC/RagA subfamily outer membrane receptor
MIKRIFFSSMFLAIFLVSTNLYAQERMLHGIITTFDSIPLIGASIKVQSTKQVVLTDSLGNFSLSCKNDDKLKVSAHGFYNQKVKLTGKIKFAAINLKLKPSEKSREVAIGYGYVSDADKLNAMAALNNNDFDYTRYDNIYEIIQSSFSGVQVINGEIIIRGTSSFNSSSAALIVVDGVISEPSILSTIRPIDVKNISVIKDGSTAVYGSRGANGVVIIDTKRGGD